MRKGETTTLVVALIGLLASFIGGAVTEAETNNEVTKAIGYDLNRTYNVVRDNNITYICNEIKVMELK